MEGGYLIKKMLVTAVGVGAIGTLVYFGTMYKADMIYGRKIEAAVSRFKDREVESPVHSFVTPDGRQMVKSKVGEVVYEPTPNGTLRPVDSNVEAIDRLMGLSVDDLRSTLEKDRAIRQQEKVLEEITE